VVRDVDVVATGNCSVSFTVTTLDERVSERLEPGAPPPSRRLKAMRRLTDEGVPCSARLDPIIPFLNDGDLEATVRALAEAGAKHVTASTYKARLDNFSRVVSAFPDLAGKLRELYWVRGEAIGSVRYLPSEIRRGIVNKVESIAKNYGLSFSSCREGVGGSSPGVRCDGTHLIPAKRTFSHKT
jgi:DNA repair photolyase